MNKQEIYDYLDQKNISYEITEHQAVYNMHELSQIEIPHKEAEAKNLSIRDDKKRNYYLITVKGNKHVDLKQFRKKYNTRPLSFASEADLQNILSLSPGSVSPFGLLNDQKCLVQFYLDEDFMKSPSLIGVHPNDNTATILLHTDDLINLITEHGNPVTLIQKND